MGAIFTNLRLLIRILILIFVFIFMNSAGYAQLTGTKSIPGDYATIQAAIADLNTQGVGSGGVTFNVTAGHTETFTTDSAGFMFVTGTVTDQIIFQKSGVGANPLITASGLGTIASTTTLGSNGDGIIVFVGCDYITFDGIDLQENAGAVGNQKMEYGYYFKKASGDDACKNVIIRNCSITLDMTTIYSFGIFVSNISGTSSVTVTSTGGRSENIKLYSNTISNVYSGIQLRGYAASTPFDFYDQNIEVGVDGGNSITNYGGGATTAYGSYAIYQNNLKIANNTINGTGNATLYGIFNSTGTNSNVDVYSNTITIQGGGTTNTIYAINTTMGSTGTDNTVNIYNNIIENCTYPTVTSGLWYLLYTSSSAMNVNIYGNIIRNNSKGGTGSAYLLYQFNTAAGGNENIYNNSIYNNTNGTGITYCLYSNPVTTTIKSIHDNMVYTISGGGTVYGLYQATGVSIEIYRNTVYDLTSTTTSTSSVYGLYSSSGTDVYWYNNFVYDLKAPASTNTTAGVCGLYLSGGTNVNAFYNSILLNYTSTDAGNTSAALYVGSTTPTSADLRDNVFVNNVDITTGTRAVAFRKGGTSLTNLSANVNNNLYYAGTPDAAHLIFYDGTNSAQSLPEYQTIVSPLESASISENPPFLSTTSPYNLHMNTTIPTQVESGGTTVTTPIAITTDFDGDTRNATTPDIGADEFTGIGADLTAPNITYTTLPNTSNTTSVSLTATITDASGVAGGSNIPRLYIKKSTDVSYVFDNVPVVVGDDYTFTINYSAVGGVVVGDTIQYYVAAQDIPGNSVTNPFGGSGSNPPGTVPPPTPNYYLIVDSPLSGTYTVGLSLFKQLTGKNIYFETKTRTVTRDLNGIDSYEDINVSDDEKINPVILDNSPRLITVTEKYNVMLENGKQFDQSFFLSDESRGVYPTITAAVNDLILRGISGPVTFLLVDNDYPNETYPIMIPDIVGSSVANTITFKPSTGIQAVIPGSESQGTSTFQLGGADYVIIDGSNTNGGTSKDLHITSQIGAPAFHFYGGSNNNIVKNTVFESENTSTGSGTFLFGAAASGDSNYIDNCTIKNSDTVATQHAVGVYFFSTNTSSFNTVTNCDVYNFTDYGFRPQGAPSSNNMIIGNNIYHTIPSAKTSIYGIYISRQPGLLIEGNMIYDLQSTAASPTITAIYILGSSGNPVDITVVNNVISLSNAVNQPAGTIRGIDYFAYAANSFYAYYNTVYIGGSDVTGGSAYGIDKRDAAVDYVIMNNAVYDSRSNGTGTGLHYGIFISNTSATGLFQSNYNDYYTDGTGGTFGHYGTVDYTTLADWITATGLDSNSISSNPQFVSTSDLRPVSTSPLLLAGTPIPGFSTDILGVTRNVTNPTIGAYEEGVLVPMSGVYTVGLSAFKNATGKNIYFEKRTRTVTKDLNGPDSYLDLNAASDVKNVNPKIDHTPHLVQVTEEYKVMLENGKPFDTGFFKSDESMGIYPTITAAVNDLILRGVSGPVTFLLVDNNYPNETYPIDIPAISGVDAANNVTFKPGPGVQAEIPGSTTQTTATFRLGGADYITVDGSNTPGGTTKDLKIVGLATGTIPSIHLYVDATHNVFKNLIIESQNTSTGSGTFLFGGPAASDSNLIENCVIKNIDTVSARPGAGIYFFSTQTGTGNQMINCSVYDFFNYGIRPYGAPTTNTLISGCDIFMTQPSTATTLYGIYVGRTDNLVVENTKITELMSTASSPTIEGIYFIASSTSGSATVRNNVVSLSAIGNQPAGTLRGIDYYGYASNLFYAYFNTIYIGGTGVTGGSGYGIVKRDQATDYVLKDNAVYVTRSNGSGTGSHYGIFLSNTTASGLFSSDYNDFYTDGTGGVMGRFLTTDYTDLPGWITATGLDSNSVNLNPVFVSNIDYRPQGTSPLLDAGVSVPGITTDILGDPRGIPPTIGAYENSVFVAINAPTNLDATVDTFVVTLFWQDNSVNEDGFVIERKDGDSLSINPFVPIDSIGANGNTYPDTTVNPNNSYGYRVYAFNTQGVSDYSNVIYVTTPIPVEFTSFTADINDRNVLINWSTATETNNRGFDIERKMSSEWEKISYKEGKGSTTEPQYYSYTDKFDYKSYKGVITYRLKQIDFDGTFKYSDEIEINVDFTPKEYTLYQNYPNPFNPTTTIKYALPFDSKVRIAIYSILGELIGVVVDEVKEVGYHDFIWNASNSATGVYIYTIQAKSIDGKKSYNTVKKMMIMK